MNKVQKLQKIAKEIELCSICKHNKSGKAVPGEGSPDAEIIFVGEAPGKTESLIGRPFIGRSGKYFRSVLAKNGFKTDEIFITSPVKYLPDSKTPSLKDIEHGKVHLLKQLSVIDPKIIVLMGNVACLGILNDKISCTTRHGELVQDKYFITVHPAAAMRFPKVRKIFEKDLKSLKFLIDKGSFNVQN